MIVNRDFNEQDTDIYIRKSDAVVDEYHVLLGVVEGIICKMWSLHVFLLLVAYSAAAAPSLKIVQVRMESREKGRENVSMPLIFVTGASEQ